MHILILLVISAIPNLLLNSIYESLTGQKESVLLFGEGEEGTGEGDGAEKALTENKDKDA